MKNLLLGGVATALGLVILAGVASAQTATPTSTPTTTVSPTTTTTTTPTTTNTPTPTGSVQGAVTVPSGAPATGFGK